MFIQASCVGLLYGVTTNNASDPAFSAYLDNSIASEVELDPVLLLQEFFPYIL